MASQEHLAILNQGIDVWNEWREKHYNLIPNLDNADLSWRNLNGANFRQTNLSWTNLSHAQLENADLRYAGLIRTNFQEANLSGTDLSKARLQGAFFQDASLKKAILKEANLKGADLSGADLKKVNFSGANLAEAHFFKADLSGANLLGARLEGANFWDSNLSNADLSGANLDGTICINTNFTGAILMDCHIHGISAWSVELKGATQSNLAITPWGEPAVTVDNLEVAQFIFLLLNNAKIRDIINTITTKVVLILGRFTPERKAVLDALKDELRKVNYTPVLFDFEKPASRDVTETIMTLAHLARFIIADLTDPKSIPQELAFIVPSLPSVPIQPLLLSSQREYGMFEHFTRFPWVLPIYHYTDEGDLLQSFKEYIIDLAEKKAQELGKR